MVVEGAALPQALGVHEANLLATGAVEEAAARAASPDDLTRGAHALAHDAADLAHLRADPELNGQSVHLTTKPLPARAVPAAAAPLMVATRIGEPNTPAQRPILASESFGADSGRSSVPMECGARPAALRVGELWPMSKDLPVRLFREVPTVSMPTVSMARNS
jgi:hypothetical protein